MKELSQHLTAPIEKHEVKEIRKQDIYAGSMVVHKGQRIYKYNVKDKKISIVEGSDYESPVAKLPIKKQEYRTIEDIAAEQQSRKLKIDIGNLYVVAINENNARRKFNRML